MNADEKTREKKRVLGDEWENWNENLDEGRIYDENTVLFMIFATSALMFLMVVAGIVLYMIEPRLALIHPLLVQSARLITFVILGLFIFGAILILSSVYTGKSFLISTRLGQAAAAKLLPVALAIAQRLGISRDRLGNSFVKFSNAIVRATHKPCEGKTIILLPRCLNTDLKKEVHSLGEKANVGVFTVGGGGAARKIILKERPSSVIGVACERDLISGIQDVSPKMTTIGITNKRPEGPCLNTVIDLDDVKKAIQTLTGKRID